jgi:ribonuclease Z
MRWLPARAWENGVFAVFANNIGVDGDTIKPGLAMILDPHGEVLVECHALDDDVAVGLLTAEAFEQAHPAGEALFEGIVYEAEGLTVEARIMDQGIPCLTYAVRERPRTDVDMAALSELGLKPGRWIRELKDSKRGNDEDVVLDGRTHRLGELRRRLLVRTPGSCLAYLTDFGLDERSERELGGMLEGCDVIVGEASYRDADAELARRHRHFTGAAMGRLAAAVGARKLVLFHLSDRYTRDGWMGLLAEVRQVFPAAGFPSHWGLE